jgi:predicted dehydrogenase
MKMGMKLGICGVGEFGACFTRLFKAHPLVEELVLADVVPERARAEAEKLGVRRVFSSLDELCRSDVDAVAIFSQRQLHGPQALQALRAGKHVYSAVPMGMSVEEIARIVETVKRTGLLYMMGETSYYYPCTLYCRKRFQSGEFGRFSYAEAQYLHDMEHFYVPFQHSGGAEWKKVAGIPPMYYPTHSVSMILSVTGARATHVSCLGFVDQHEDVVFGAGRNHWDNPFSNESALMRTSDGGMMRINEMRRVGWFGGNSVYMSFFGTEGSFEQNAVASCWATRRAADLSDLTEELKCAPSARLNGEGKTAGAGPGQEFFTGVCKHHPVGRLPETFKGLPNGHCGSHQFLVDDFVTAWAKGTLPPCNVWNSARWNIPGLIAHESAKRNGEMLPIPDMGDAPISH